MLIACRRTGGLFALLTLAGAAVAATVLTVAVAAIVLAVAVATASVLVIGRAVVPRLWRRDRPVLPKTPLPHETIDTTAVTAISSSDTHNVPRMDDSTR
jgi:hypothetical protein